DRDHRALPPRDRGHRRAHRLWRRTAGQAPPARARVHGDRRAPRRDAGYDRPTSTLKSKPTLGGSAFGSERYFTKSVTPSARRKSSSSSAWPVNVFGSFAKIFSVASARMSGLRQISLPPSP